MLKSRTTTEVFEYDGTSRVEHIEVHRPDAYVTFDHQGATHRIQEITCRSEPGCRYRHQVQFIRYYPGEGRYGSEVGTMGVSRGDLEHIFGSEFRKAFPDLID